MTLTLPFPLATNDEEQLVANSIAAMDHLFPGWHMKVDTSILDMGLTSKCVLGQATDKGYMTEVYLSRPSIPGRSLAANQYFFAGATRVWKREIERLQQQETDPVFALRQAVRTLRDEGYDVNVILTPPPVAPKPIVI